MEVRSELLRDTKRRNELVATKLRELESVLPRGEHAGLTSAALAEQLFTRAPLDFLRQRSAIELAEVTKICAESIEDFRVAKKDALQIQTSTTPVRTILTVTVTDRPFIVNTILECCREDDVRIISLLHPIFSVHGAAVSFNYLEIDPLSEKAVGTLAAKLRLALETLIPVTEDYAASGKQVEAIATLLGAGAGEALEVGEFLNWLLQGEFNFMGYGGWEARGEQVSCKVRQGLLRSGESVSDGLLREIQSDVDSLRKSGGLIAVSSLRSVSPVHRRVRLSNIAIREPAKNGVEKFHTITGIFTSRALAQECSTIPLIRRKFEQIVAAEGFTENTHDYKSVANIIDSLPKEVALGLESEALRHIAISVLDMATSSETVTSVWPDRDGRGVHVLVVMMRKLFDSSVRESIERYLQEVFGVAPITSEYHLDITNRPVVRLYFYVPTQASTSNFSVDDLHARIVELARSWYEDLEAGLSQKYKNGNVHHLLAKYANAFPENYRATQSVEDCVQDIVLMEQLDAQTPFRVGIANTAASESDSATIVMLNVGQEITISQVLPVLENFGFDVINERFWKLTPAGAPIIASNRFRVRTRSGAAIDVERFTRIVSDGIAQALTGSDNDILNTVMLEAGLDLRAVSVLRTYCRFLWQVKQFASRSNIYRTLARNPHLAAKFWEIFELLFDPARKDSLEVRRARSQEQCAAFIESLRDVKDITSDRIFRSLLSLLENTVRTSVYLGRPYIALKFKSGAIDIMPQPRPLFEIFVNSPLVEGVHLRSGMVARGGIRWSDRPDDYRSEVLGLMKTQRIKNVLIVPTGSKGGFIVKNLPSDSKQIAPAVERAYCEYIRALLSITDNRCEGKVVHPDAVLAYDGEDPYLVVAADKGTATFSDMANRIAVEEYSFWLADAFASGGSNGYDHKKYAITARGAWECAKRHFRDLGKDFEHDPFTAIGVGDMAGDVFGNGLLLSDQFKLLAAFNHRHIFIDPSPDPAKSFKERKRLFDLKGSQWSDYSAALISKGGAVFDRFEKEIAITPEARAALGIGADVPKAVSGETLINLILKAPVELLWNGGIGTYVKARFQSHSEVNDGANDGVRVNSDELRCKIASEGGNLGFTQAARIEFGLRGGALNTDAIDNSGGVDLSDHEVNLKILFSGLLNSGKLSFEDRNKALQSMATEACELVLDHNRSHALVLTIQARRSVKTIQYFQALLRDLVKMGYVNRALDSLPDDDELFDRQNDGLGLTRPELAVCLATSKMWVKDVLLSSDILDEPLLRSLLLDYFPRVAQEKWRPEILSHPLAKNILATQIANFLVDGMGISAIHRLSEQFAVTPVRVIECALTAELLFNTRGFRSTVLLNEAELGTQTYLQLVQTLATALVEATAWLVSRHSGSIRIGQLFERYQNSWKELQASASEIFPRISRERYAERRKRLVDLGIESHHADSLALFSDATTAFDLLWCAQQGKHSLTDAARVYGEVSERLMVDTLLQRCSDVETGDRWESELLLATVQDIRGSIAELTLQLLSENRLAPEAINIYLQQLIALDRWRGSVEEIRQRAPDVASLAVLARQLQGFARA